MAKGSSVKASSFIHFGHENWNLILHMMLGIRHSVHNVMHDRFNDLTEDDFFHMFRYELVPKKTDSSAQSSAFEFYDFAPRVFDLIRKKYCITNDSYLKSIGPENLIGNLLMGNINSYTE